MTTRISVGAALLVAALGAGVHGRSFRPLATIPKRPGSAAKTARRKAAKAAAKSRARNRK